jgi:hypothetical protein
MSHLYLCGWLKKKDEEEDRKCFKSLVVMSNDDIDSGVCARVFVSIKKKRVWSKFRNDDDDVKHTHRHTFKIRRDKL